MVDRTAETITFCESYKQFTAQKARALNQTNILRIVLLCLAQSDINPSALALIIFIEDGKMVKILFS